jgi:bifunctional UDP-N-acetylglucosamine pyrophosphorylase/glucosamine-1-phosphate N-acetyltransferase
MILHVLDALGALDMDRVVVVVGHGAEEVSSVLGRRGTVGPELVLAHQPAQLGTGDAVAVGLSGLRGGDGIAEDVVVVPGDTPLLRGETLEALVERHRSLDAAATLLTAELADPVGYGRVIRGADGTVLRVVEEKDADASERAVTEINTSVYCFRRPLLAGMLQRLRPVNAQGEYYLTDVVRLLRQDGHAVGAVGASDTTEVLGVNDRAQLAVVEAELRSRINLEWMRAGVTMVDPASTYVDVESILDADVVLHPGSVLRGRCVVASGAEIGPWCTLEDTEVGADARVSLAACSGAVIPAGSVVGPFAALGHGETAGARRPQEPSSPPP